jgi:DNA-nicking Smr family endonuclease
MMQRLRQALRELFGITPTLDLHGLGVRDALRATEAFLREAQEHREPVVRIVYGKGKRSPGGRGVLREVIPHWLQHEGASHVDRFERLPDATGADGAVKVWVRQRRI